MFFFYYGTGIWTFSTIFHSLCLSIPNSRIRHKYEFYTVCCTEKQIWFLFILKISIQIPYFSKSVFPVSNFTINNKFSFLNNNFNSTGNFPHRKNCFFFCLIIVVAFYAFSTWKKKKNYSTKEQQKQYKQSNFNWVEEIHCVLWLATNNTNFTSPSFTEIACSWQQQQSCNKSDSQFLTMYS